MEPKQEINKEKAILSILCNSLYYQVKNIVNKYAVKQTEKDIVNAEEPFIRLLYRDFIDSDIFSDFQVLFIDDFYIINCFKKSQKNDKESLLVAVSEITQFIQSESCKQQLQSVCAKYKKESKTERILSESVRKVGIYLPQLSQEECDLFRKTMLKLFSQILTFCAESQ